MDTTVLRLIEDLTAGLDGTFSSGVGNNVTVFYLF